MNHVLPGFIRFEVLDECPARIGPGVTYDYRLRLHGLPFRWRTEITAVEEPGFFEDRQARGPYASFVHQHFYEDKDGGTDARDLIRYRPPGGALAGVVDALVVRRDLRRLFEHRHAALLRLYESGRDPAGLLDTKSDAAAESVGGGA